MVYLQKESGGKEGRTLLRGELRGGLDARAVGGRCASALPPIPIVAMIPGEIRGGGFVVDYECLHCGGERDDHGR